MPGCLNGVDHFRAGSGPARRHGDPTRGGKCSVWVMRAARLGPGGEPVEDRRRGDGAGTRCAYAVAIDGIGDSLAIGTECVTGMTDNAQGVVHACR